MVRVATKARALDNRPETLNGRNWLPRRRHAEDKLDICIFPTIRELALQLSLDGLVEVSQEVAVSVIFRLYSFIGYSELNSQPFNFLHGRRAYALISRIL